MQHGQTIEIFLPDGSPQGIWKVSMMGKSILATVSPRNNLDTLIKTRPEVQKQGVYILAGTDPATLKHVIYIGQSENVWQRLRQHNDDVNRDFWERTIIFTSKDDNFNKAHAQYIESRLISLANTSKRAIIKNGNAPTPLRLSEANQAYMEEWLDWIKLLLPVLGYNFAVPVPTSAEVNTPDPIRDEDDVTIRLKMNAVGVQARLYQINNEWIIMEGSTFREETKKSLWDSLQILRETMIKDEILVDHPNQKGYLRLTRNYPASSLSMASSLIAGASYSGTITWQMEDTGEFYWDWQQRQLDAAEDDLLTTDQQG